jgi:hypothetical protein
LVLAQRALAYARVYAEHDEALTEQLARISLPRAAKARKASATKPDGGEAVAQVEPAAAESSASAAEALAVEAPADVEADADADASSAEAPAPALRNGKRRVARTLARHAPSRP